MKTTVRIVLLMAVVVLASCGGSRKQFTLNGSLQNMDQGEFHIYSPDGLIEGVDTIHMARGEFTYRISCQQPGLLMLVFPNHSQQPVFAEPGKTVALKADASHLKELRVNGTKENKLMNQFRRLTEKMGPDEERQQAIRFIEEHPESAVALYLLNRYWLEAPQPDYQTAQALVKKLAAAQKENVRLEQLQQQISLLQSSSAGQSLPAFNLPDIHGEGVSQLTLQAAPIAIITTFSPSQHPSMDMQRALRRNRSKLPAGTKVLSICIDGNRARCEKTVQTDTMTWNVACPEQLLETPAVKAMSLQGMAEYIIVKKGKISKRGNGSREFEEELKKLL